MLEKQFCVFQYFLVLSGILQKTHGISSFHSAIVCLKIVKGPIYYIYVYSLPNIVMHSIFHYISIIIYIYL